jgi:hypothetical protein
MRQDGRVSTDSESWKYIQTAVLRLLNGLDPYGLEPGADGGAPVGEYSSEAVPMASHLINRLEISAADSDAIWEAWFGEPLSTIDSDRFSRFVADLNALVKPSP